MEFYHVLNRGVDRRKIFLDGQDHFRFIHDLFEFNDTEPVNNVTYFFRAQSKDIVSPYIRLGRNKRKLLVDILAFCLMPNHYHLFLTPRVENGMSLFMRKLNIGYAKYFNEKYLRKGALFEGRYKSILVQRESYFYHLPHYIHLNPLDLTLPQWREKPLSTDEYKKAMRFLETYRWSSLLDCFGKKNFPSVTSRGLLLDAFNGEAGYQRDLKSWLQESPAEEKIHFSEQFGKFLLE